MDRKFAELLGLIRQQMLVSATLSSPKIKNNILKVSIRSIVIKNQFAYQISEYGQKQVFHRNENFDECMKFVEQAFQNYRQGVFAFKDWSYHVLVSKDNKMTVIKKGVKADSSLMLHNVKKSYVLQEGTVVPFLVELGIMTLEGKVIAKKYDKFRQVNRFLEMVRDVIDDLPNDCLEVIDFGCGKAYLTFALHYYLQEIQKRDIRITGIDLKEDVINQCRKIAEKLKLEGLSFVIGNIHDFESKSDVDLMISLHACDTATDAALEKAVRWNARVILCVPCCQHELYGQIRSQPLESVFRHGILKERVAALVTDAARAEILTALGYDVQVLEFIDLEHTPKNLLLRAVKGVSKDKREQAMKRYEALRKELNISPSLERLSGF